MVATRRGTRVGPEEIKETGADVGGRAENSGDVDTSTTPADSQSQAIKESQSKEPSGIINEDPDVSKGAKSTSQTVTRSRRRSGQSEGEVSEADSTSSSHSLRMTRSRQSLTGPTDSSRTLRGCRSVVVTDPILELKEDAELSEAESNCSSVSTRDTRRRSTRSKSSGSQTSVLVSKTVSKDPEVIEISDSESNCSSASGVISRRTRSARIQAKLVKCPPPPPSHIEEVSDAESCCSGISENPVARRVRPRTRSTAQQGDKGLSHETATKASQKPETPKKQKNSTTGSVPEIIASEGEQNLFSPRRSLRTRQISEQEHVNTSNKESNISASSTKSEVPTTSIKHTQEPLDLSKINQDSANFPIEVIDLEQMPEETINTNKDSKNQSHDLIDLKQNPEEPISKDTEDLSEEIIDPEEESAEPVKETANINEALTDLEQEALDTSNYVVSDGVDIHSQILEGTSHKLDGESSSKGFGSSDNHSSRPNISLYLDSDESEDSQHSDEGEESTDDEEMEEEEAENTIGSMKSKDQPSGDALGDGLFVIDTVPGLDPSKNFYVDHKKDTAKSKHEESGEEESDEDFIDEDEEEEDEENDLLNSPNPALKLSSSIKTGLNIKDLGGLCISFDGEKPNPGPSLVKKMKDHSDIDKIMKKSVITPDIEKQESIKPYKESMNKLKQQRKQEREKTTGLGWFDMKAPEMTEELKNDLKALKMRAAMDPKRFYKKNDRDGFPKYFQVGTVVDSPLDFYHSRIPKKERKRTLVDELLADSEFRRYNKKKYREIMAEKAAIAEGKKKRKKKTFRK